VGGGGSIHHVGLVVGSGNAATAPLDFTNPLSGGAITAGSTWHFQYWFRDSAAGGAGADLSDGLTVTFQ
jgi:hypothetical protein